MFLRPLSNARSPAYTRLRCLPSIARMATTKSTPTEDTIRSKLTSALSPTALTIHNDSHKHAHHAAMASNYASESPNVETHFRVHVVSEEFKGKMQAARHRMVYKLLADELSREGGVHALQLVTRTTDEEEAVKVKAATER